jgi:SAM-dependent methyltransferase
MKSSEVFDDIYRKSTWGFQSGPGSDPVAAKPWIDIVNGYLSLPDVVKVLDIGCGDWRLGEMYNLENKKYIGIDVSDEALTIARKKAKHGAIFMHDDAATMKIEGEVDLILIKDVLQHLPNATIEIIMDKILTHARYALICNDIGTGNGDTHVGGHRGLNLQDDPFLYPVTNLWYYGAQIKIINLYERDAK